VILALATALARAFPRVPLLSQAQPQLAVLAEMAADDAALRRHRRDDLAAALVALATAGARPATLAASGPEAIVRLQRILTTQPQPRAGLARLAAIAGLIPPVVIACLPLLLAAPVTPSQLARTLLALISDFKLRKRQQVGVLH
jgi:hypothetical protein